MINVKELSDVQLISIVMGVDLDKASKLLALYSNDLSELATYLVHPNIKGIGEHKTLVLQSAFELGLRRATLDEINRRNETIINNSRAVFAQFKHALSALNHEELWVLYLSKSGKLISKRKIGEGSVDCVTADVRKIAQYAIELMASNIALCHNHPHSTTRPSQDDRNLTKTVVEAMKLFGINVRDHVIISDGRYFSFADNGEI